MDSNYKDNLDSSAFDLDAVTVNNQMDTRSELGIPPCIKLPEDQHKELESEITEYIEAAIEDESRQAMLSQLAENELRLQAKFDNSNDKPFDASSESCSTIIQSHCNIISNCISRTFIIQPYFLSVGSGDKEQKLILQDFMNQKARYELDYESFILKLSKLATETPAAIVNPEWVREIRYDVKSEIFLTLDGYKAKFSNAELAGLSESDYQKQLKRVQADIDDKGYHEAEYEFPNVIKDCPVLNIYHPSDIIMYPFNALSVNLAKLIGVQTSVTFDDILCREKSGLYFEGVSNKIKSGYVNSEGSDTDEIKSAQEEELGVNDSSNSLENYKAKIYKVVRGHIRLDLENNGISRDYEFAYAVDEGVLLRVAKSRAHCTKRPYFFAEIDPKSKSIWGTDVPTKLKNPYEAISSAIRQMIDSNSLSNIPMFKGNSLDKEWFENNYQEISPKPGKIYWLKNSSSFEQMRTQPVDINATLKMINYIVQEAEMADGVNKAMAGQPMSDDPDAPGIKNAMYIQQSNFMINQYIKNLMPVLEDIIDYVRALYDQRLKRDEVVKVTRYDSDKNEDMQEYTKDELALLNPDLKITIRPQKVDDNLPLRLNNLRQDLDFLMAIPDINQNPFAKRALIRNMLWLRENYTLDEINQITAPLGDIIGTIDDARQDLSAAEQYKQQAAQITNQFDADMKGVDDSIIQNLSSIQNLPPQGVPNQGE